MAHPSDVLKTGDIALGRFAAAKMIESGHREIGTRMVGSLLPAHPLLVMDVDHRKREATVMLLGTEKEGNGGSQLGFTKQEQALAKLEREGEVRTVFKPHNLSVMPLHVLYPNQGGHITEDTMNRVHKELGRAIQEKTVTMTHLSRDGTISLYDPIRERPGKVIMEAPPRTTTYEGGRSRPPTQVYRAEYTESRVEPGLREDTSNRRERRSPTDERVEAKASPHAAPQSVTSVTHTAETVAHEASTARRASEIAEAALDVAKFAAKQGVRVVGGGPIGDVMAAADVSMAAFSFVDNHTGHAISEGPIGQGVKYVGEHTGAFKAAHEVSEAAKPYIEKAHQIADPILDRAGTIADKVAEKTGITAAVHLAEDQAGKAVDWSAQQLAKVQQGFSELTHAIGYAAVPLNIAEARAVAEGVSAARSGDAVAIHPNGTTELLSNAFKNAQTGGLHVMSVDEFKERLGLDRIAQNQVSAAQVLHTPPIAQAHERSR